RFWKAILPSRNCCASANKAVNGLPVETGQARFPVLRTAMLSFFTIVIMLIVAYAHWREGLYTACCTLINVVLAGLITFNFWEPLANILDTTFRGWFVSGYEDFVVLIVLFALTLGMLRMLTNNLCPAQIIQIGYVQQAGGALFGLVAGYLM